MTTTHQPSATDTPPAADTVADVRSRLIDHWFPCGAVDAACQTSAGSGLSEKALFTWFASRPIAQARAAVLTTLLPDTPDVRRVVDALVRQGAPAVREEAHDLIRQQYPAGRPVVLDMFSGRGIIPLEAARLGVTAVATDLSPVATLASKLLAEYPLRDWSAEPVLPLPGEEATLVDTEPRLLRDVRAVIREVGRRALADLAHLYPPSEDGRLPWAYLWAVTIPCDNCKHTTPLLGSLVLRHPYGRTGDEGQALRIRAQDGQWTVEVIDGVPDQDPPFAAAAGRRGKSARCVHCGHLHSLDTVKAKGFNGDYGDALVAVADGDDDSPKKTWRAPTAADKRAAAEADQTDAGQIGDLAAIPDEAIPEGNNHTVRASAYGYRSYGELMNHRQALQTVAYVRAIRAVRAELQAADLSADYVDALTAYAASNLVRKLRRSTRGSGIDLHGNRQGTGQNRIGVNHIFADQSKVAFQHDYLEVGPDSGPGTWLSVAESGWNALAKVLAESRNGSPARVRRASAVALPFRDSTVDAVVCDPPYYNMIDYGDASDLFHVWLKRILWDVFPDLFGVDGLQDKTDEIIVKNGTARGEHRTREFYEQMLGRAFSEARRVLRTDGHLVVVFGHSDPDAWRRLLGALHDAGFVVTSSWPSRTESGNTGVATIKVTVTIGCRVASADRPVATAAQVDREVTEAVKAAVREWDQDGLALTDQLMAAYGPAMAVYGRYAKILKPDGTTAELDRYLTLARTAVRDATALKLDELPLETFDAPSRFAVFWQRLYGRTDVPKGEARFLAQADNLRLEDMRGALLTETKSGFRLRLDAPSQVTDKSSTFEVARAMADAWDRGATEAVASVLTAADRQPNDAHLWAVVGEIVRQVPPSDAVARALTAVQRNAGTITTLAQRAAADRRDDSDQLALTFSNEE